jgi:hypothetical protein
VPPEKATSRILPHLSGKTLEGTLSLVHRGIEARVYHPVTGPRASRTDSWNHHKSRGAPGYTYYQKAKGQPPYWYWSQHLNYSFLSQTQVLQEKYCLEHIRPAFRALFHSAFSLLLGRFHFCHSFLIVPETLTPLLGQDVLSKLGVLLPPGEYFCFPLIVEQVYPMVWMMNILWDGHEQQSHS